MISQVWLIMRDFHYGRVCFKSVKTLGALHSKLSKRPRLSASTIFKAKTVELLGLYPIHKYLASYWEWNGVSATLESVIYTFFGPNVTCGMLYVIFNIVESLSDRKVACSASNFETCVWRTVSCHSSHHPQEVILAQFSLCVHKSGLEPNPFH